MLPAPVRMQSMTDIVWKLRNDVPCISDIGCAWELCNQAADEIGRLRAALEEIAKYEIDEGCPCSACRHSALARASLEGGDDQA